MRHVVFMYFMSHVLCSQYLHLLQEEFPFGDNEVALEFNCFITFQFENLSPFTERVSVLILGRFGSLTDSPLLPIC